MQIQYRDIKAFAEDNFKILCQTKYNYYLLDYMRELLKGSKEILTKARKKKQKQEMIIEHLYKLNSSFSRIIKISVDEIWKEGEEIAVNDVNEKVKSGVLYLFCVLLSLII